MKRQNQFDDEEFIPNQETEKLLMANASSFLEKAMKDNEKINKAVEKYSRSVRIAKEMSKIPVTSCTVITRSYTEMTRHGMIRHRVTESLT